MFLVNGAVDPKVGNGSEDSGSDSNVWKEFVGGIIQLNPLDSVSSMAALVRMLLML